MIRSVAQWLVAGGLVVLAGKIGLAKDSIPFVPSPMYVVEKMLTLAEVKNGDLLFDMAVGMGGLSLKPRNATASKASASI